MLEKEFRYFSDHFEEIAKNHIGEYAIIKNQAVVGYTKTEKAALIQMKSEKLGTFLIQHCTEDSLKPIVFRPRVVFV